MEEREAGAALFSAGEGQARQEAFSDRAAVARAWPFRAKEEAPIRETGFLPATSR